MGLCTVSVIVKRITQAISTHLVSKNIKIPLTEAEVNQPDTNFFAGYGFPLCIGTVDGTHIPIRKPKVNPTSFINRKKYHCLNVQACVGYKHCFFDVVIKCSDSVHDARVFGNSGINAKLRNWIISPCKKTIVEAEQAVPICILSDPAYLLLFYLMKEFVKGVSSSQEKFFGYQLSFPRMVVECTLGWFKARCGILKRPMDLDLDNMITAINPCLLYLT